MKGDAKDLDRIFNEKVIKAFTEKLEPGEGGCMNFNGYIKKNGYGEFSISSGENRIKITAHRMSMGYACGAALFKPEFHICHHCDNRRCANPEHLYVGTHQQNMDDMVAKNRSAVSYGNAKLSWDIVDMIRANQNIETQFWVEELSVSSKTINNVKNNKIWKDEMRDVAFVPVL